MKALASLCVLFLSYSLIPVNAGQDIFTTCNTLMMQMASALNSADAMIEGKKITPDLLAAYKNKINDVLSTARRELEQLSEQTNKETQALLKGYLERARMQEENYQSKISFLAGGDNQSERNSYLTYDISNTQVDSYSTSGDKSNQTSPTEEIETDYGNPSMAYEEDPNKPPKENNPPTVPEPGDDDQDGNGQIPSGGGATTTGSD